MDQDRLREDLRDAEECLDYLMGLAPFHDDDRLVNADVANRRTMAVEDVKSRIKEIREEIADLEEEAEDG